MTQPVISLTDNLEDTPTSFRVMSASLNDQPLEKQKKYVPLQPGQYKLRMIAPSYCEHIQRFFGMYMTNVSVDEETIAFEVEGTLYYSFSG